MVLSQGCIPPDEVFLTFISLASVCSLGFFGLLRFCTTAYVFFFSFLIMLYFSAASFVCLLLLSLVSHLLFVFHLPFFSWLRYPQRVDHWHQKPHATTSFNVLLPAISFCVPSISLFSFSLFLFFLFHPLCYGFWSLQRNGLSTKN